MANHSLAATPFSRNDIRDLAYIFEESLTYYCSHSSPLEELYYKTLKTLVGLAFTAHVVNCDSTIYFSHFKRFLEYKNFKDEAIFPELSLRVSEMVFDSERIFRRAGHPDYYRSFSTALKYAVNHVSTLCKNKKTSASKRLLELILVD